MNPARPSVPIWASVRGPAHRVGDGVLDPWQGGNADLARRDRDRSDRRSGRCTNVGEMSGVATAPEQTPSAPQASHAYGTRRHDADDAAVVDGERTTRFVLEQLNTRAELASPGHRLRRHRATRRPTVEPAATATTPPKSSTSTSNEGESSRHQRSSVWRVPADRGAPSWRAPIVSAEDFGLGHVVLGLRDRAGAHQIGELGELVGRAP